MRHVTELQIRVLYVDYLGSDGRGVGAKELNELSILIKVNYKNIVFV